MRLSELTRPDLIKQLEAESKREAIGELVDLLLQQHEISLKQRAPVLEAVLENERELGTGMEQGIAVPHASTDTVEDILCAVGIAPKGVPFDTRDGKPAQIVVLLVVPRRNFSGEVRALAAVQLLLKDAELRKRLVQSKDGAGAYALIEEHESSRV